MSSPIRPPIDMADEERYLSEDGQLLSSSGRKDYPHSCWRHCRRHFAPETLLSFPLDLSFPIHARKKEKCSDT